VAKSALELTPRIQRHLDNDVVVWLATAGPGRPQAVPVWFWWDGSSFLIYSIPGQKVRDIEANSLVQLHLNTDRGGDFVVRFDGEAEILKDHPLATRVRKYIDKYRDRIRAYGWTPRVFAERYHIAIRIRPTRLRS
jgi:PPOX class probable F420-dependent enzyme